jgi:DNA-3-methyladenine glycosylase II
MNNRVKPENAPVYGALETLSATKHAAKIYLELCQRDSDLKKIFEKYGQPPIWKRQPGFVTLIQIILEQQVSLASAQAAFDRLTKAVTELSPETFLELSDEALKQIGFSRQKTSYGRTLAKALIEGRLQLEQLEQLSDAEAKSELCKIKGIGSWSSDIYLLMALRRPDIWPAGDLALAVALQGIKNLPKRPSPSEVEALAEAWRPYRSSAARLLWHYYLSRR